MTADAVFAATTRARPILFAAPDIDEEDVAAVTEVLRSGWITTGAESDALEVELAEYLGGEAQVVAMSSCTAALEVAAAYHRLGPTARVGVPTWTFASTALAMMRNGATPVLLDIEPDTLNLSIDSLERAIDSEGLDAVVAVHMGGVPVRQAVYEVCTAAGIPVIEDAAHALGASDERGRIGQSSAPGACFSFYATKNLTSAEGGALATTDPELVAFARSYRLHGLSLDAYARYLPGRPKEYDLVAGGIKANLPDLLATLARAQLRRFDELQARRRVLACRYRSNLVGAEGLQTIPGEVRGGSADHLMLVLLPEGTDRGALQAALSDDGIGTSVHFRPLHTFEWLSSRSLLAPGGMSAADGLRHRALSLPLHTKLADDDVDRVCERLLHHLPSP